MSDPVVDNAVLSGNSSVAIPTDISGQILDLDEDDDLEVFSKGTTLTEGSSFNASMQTSPASMINQYKFEEEEGDADTKDIFVTVDNPESLVTAIETYVTYRVMTKTTRSEFDASEFEVRRRYQDFLWLKGRLEEAHPTLIVHPLPEKFVMKGMVERFNEDFIETRRKALHRFLNRIAEHPIFSSTEDFKIFLTAESGELTSHKKQGPSFLSRMGETVKAVAASVRGVRNRPEEFTDMQEYVDAFTQKIGSLDKVSQRIVREKKEHLEELKECVPIYTLWSQSEEELAEPLKSMAGCLDSCCKETEEQVKELNDHLIPALHEYVLCTETLKAVLRRRDNIQADFEAKTEALAMKKADKDAMRDELDKMEDRLEWANNALKSDWTRWQKVMRNDLRSAFVDTAERNINYYEKCLAVWESFLHSQRTEAEENGEVDFS
ncbi:sorting nexin-7 isoform X2 [Pimephales promelas]|uniref:sorting nexin-7 isoform X2 n=1 Tax=Pimephales promelas TaxID=90988 RepID=UPI001955A037|nr:sorting nexin-7 isoform X2 [Pimephales promelas]KAG1951820.1 sorting nexin-7 [Pimephales promelas]